MSKGLGLSVAAGLASGLVYLSALSGGVIGALLIYLTPLPLVLVGLSFGLVPAAVGSGLAVIIVGAAMPRALPVFAALGPAPVLLLVRQALVPRPTAEGRRGWASPGTVVSWLAMLAIVLMVVGAALAPTRGLGIEATVRHTVAKFLEQTIPTMPAEIKDSAATLWSALFPAMLGGAWLMMVVANGIAAQWTAAKAGHAQRPTPAYTELDLPAWLLVVLAGLATVGATAPGDVGYLARNAAVLLLWPYAFAGVARVHRALSARPNARILLALFYVAFFAMFGWALMAVAGLGLVSHWMRLRRREAGSGQEEK